jgi:hypothetical protein
MIELILIQFIVVFIVDISGFIDTVKEKLSKLLTNNRIVTTNYRIRPFDCSLCANFWTSLIYLLVTHQFTIPYIAFVCLMSGTTTLTKDIFFTLSDCITKILQKISNL